VVGAFMQGMTCLAAVLLHKRSFREASIHAVKERCNCGMTRIHAEDRSPGFPSE